MEALSLLRSPVNAVKLKEAIVAVEAREIEEQALIDEVASSVIKSEACDDSG